jgi:hypothetical protein
MVVGCSDSYRTSETAQVAAAADVASPVARSQPRASANIFYSGHSLMDRPLPDFVQRIAESQNSPNQWNRQYVVGSSIQWRTRGADPGGWGGYHSGYNRDGEGLDVIAELRTPKTIAGPYDVLVITEQHTMLEVLLNSDTVRLLRHYHERLIDGNPAGTTYFYEPWFNIDDKANPRRWIAYERAASPIWQCMATRVNESLQAEGRTDRIVSLPAGLALARLVERATTGNGVQSITRRSVFETINSIIADDVHLSPLGAYYISLVTYSSVYRIPAKGAWHPDSVSSVQAAALQDIAWDFVSNYYARYQPLTLEECRERLSRGDTLASLWFYIRQAYWRKDVGAAHSYVRYLRRLIKSRRVFRSESAENPFFFDRATDTAYWLPGTER